MSQEYAEATVDWRRVFDGKLLKVREDRVALPDGTQHVREYVEHPGAVMVIAETAEGRIVFERQYRYPLRRMMLELPAGKIDSGEDMRRTAERELREETGYAASEWRHLGLIHPCIGYSDERIEIFLARGLRQLGASLDHGEHIELCHFTLDEALGKVLSGEITDGKTVAGLLWADRMLRQG